MAIIITSYEMSNMITTFLQVFWKFQIFRKLFYLREIRCLKKEKIEMKTCVEIFGFVFHLLSWSCSSYTYFDLSDICQLRSQKVILHKFLWLL